MNTSIHEIVWIPVLWGAYGWWIGIESVLIRVMDWRRKGTRNNYLNQCWHTKCQPCKLSCRGPSKIGMCITVTSKWARWRLKSTASRLFTQPYIQAQIKENIKAPRHWPLWWGIHRWPVNSPHKGPVTWKMLPFDDVIVDSPSLLRSKHSAHLTPVLDFGHSWLWWYKYSLFNFNCILAQDSDFESRRHKLSFYSDQGTFSVTWSKLRLYSANHRAGY